MVKLLQRLEQDCDPYNLIVFTNHPHHYGSDYDLHIYSSRDRRLEGRDSYDW